MVIPSVIERTLPVRSYDIVINSGDGKEIWKKTDQVPQGRWGPQSIVLDNYDIGNLTISISNIVPDPTIVDLLNQQSNNTNQFAVLNQTESMLPTDSVKFQTTILVIWYFDPRLIATNIMIPYFFFFAFTFLLLKNL